VRGDDGKEPGVKECFGIDLANRFFAGAYGVMAEDAKQRQELREECYGCPDFEHCYQVLSLVYNLRMAEEARRGGQKPRGQLG
jgi:hypothetical protein